jgi:hypothetical protein
MHDTTFAGISVGKPDLTIESMLQEAKDFCMEESAFANAELFGVTDGKAVGTYVEHKFKNHVLLKYNVLVGSSEKGIDFPAEEINTDVKVTSVKQPQSSCPFKTAEQKIFGLGYNLLLFVYDKTDSSAAKTSQLEFVNCTFIEKERTADYQITKSLIALIQNDATEEEVIAYLNDKNLPVDEIGLLQIAEKILECPLNQGYLTISNALQWRVQYGRIVDLKESVDGIIKIINKD